MMDANAIERVLIVGAGTCGQQIALQFARFAFEVSVFDVDERCLDACRQRHREWLQMMAEAGTVAPSDLPAILARIRYEGDAARAADEADLLSESVPEQRDLKRQVLTQFHAICRPETIFTTNTSYMLPSSLATASGRPDRFAAFHFHVPVWYANAVDVMPHPRTEPWVVETLCQLALRIDQTPVRIQRESPGYVFNTLLAPLLMNGLDLAARGVAEFRDIDRAWMAVTKMKIGPFGIVDSIGLKTVHEIVTQWGRWISPRQVDGVAELLEGYLDRGLLGEKGGQGFYSYPDPAYGRPDFLANASPDIAHELSGGGFSGNEAGRKTLRDTERGDR